MGHQILTLPLPGERARTRVTQQKAIVGGRPRKWAGGAFLSFVIAASNHLPWQSHDMGKPAGGDWQRQKLRAEGWEEVLIEWPVADTARLGSATLRHPKQPVPTLWGLSPY